MKHIHILATGGTISAAGDAGATTGYIDGAFDVHAQIASVTNIEKLADLTGEQVMNVSSSDITRKQWLLLANRINELARDENIDGFVITHGTDTMEDTAYFLNLVVKTEKPVVLTGAMRPATASSADGPLNMYQAVAVAASDDSIGKGVLVVFSDGIYGGRDVQKTNNFKTSAFNAKDFGCLGYVRNDKAYYVNASTKRHTVNSEFDVTGLTELPTVEVAYFSLDAQTGILRYFRDHCDGLVIAGAGGSAFSKVWLEALPSVTEKIPVVRSTRIASGITIYDTEVDPVAHTLYADTLPPQKAKVLLMLALTMTKDPVEIQRMFSEY